jgi:ABC-type polysaccharide/polyol phosphate transport system ATPase subunit
MSDVVIRAEGLGKKYLIGHESQQERYTALRDVIGRTVNGFARSARDMLRGRQIIAGDEVEEFWALKDVSFEIKRGDVVGIIGRNGAGKSTLLKILSRITEPTTGRVEIKGRVASLLEVGTGFHPELTGRENIFLNGAILGMSHAEIKRKFDEIVAFAEVEKFLDTPVKRYSSGMYVRLAFAVAAHLEPEILVVDEVLAVGDAEFQKKCLGKMQDVAGHGRTVLFVSHNMSAISQLCDKGVVLKNGSLVFEGTVQTAVNLYAARDNKAEQSVTLSSCSHETSGGRVYVTVDKTVCVTLEFHVLQILRCAVELKFLDMQGTVVGVCEFGASNDSEKVILHPGSHILRVTVNSDYFFRGTYAITAGLTLPFQKGYAFTERPATFDIDLGISETRRRLDHSREWGAIRLPASLHSAGD